VVLGAVHRGFAAIALSLLLLVVAGCSVDIGGNLGQVTGSGTPETKQYDSTGFTGVRVDSAFQATVTRGDAFAVSVTVDDNLVEHLRVEVEGDTLHIGLDPGYSYRDASPKATVTMPSLTALEASGAAKAAVNGFTSGDALDLETSGAGQVTLTGVRAGQVTVDVSGAGALLGELEAQELRGEVSGAGKVSLEGTATTLGLEASGASRLELSGMTVQDADLQLSGGAGASVRVTGTLNVDASGGAKLEYYGSPTLGSIEVSGGAQVDRAGD
jgi:hypothetical protein